MTCSMLTVTGKMAHGTAAFMELKLMLKRRLIVPLSTHPMGRFMVKNGMTSTAMASGISKSQHSVDGGFS